MPALRVIVSISVGSQFVNGLISAFGFAGGSVQRLSVFVVAASMLLALSLFCSVSSGPVVINGAITPREV